MRTQKVSGAQLQSFRKLTLKKYRLQYGRFIAEGAHLVTEALRSPWNVEAILATEAFSRKGDFSPIIESAGKKSVPVFSATAAQMNSLSDTVASPGIVAIVSTAVPLTSQSLLSLPDQALVVALDSVSDPGNVGTIIRTCDWFGVDALILGGESVEVFNPKVVRSAMGSLFHLPFLHEKDLSSLVNSCLRLGWTVCTTLPRGGNAVGDIPQGRTMVVFGNESRGVSREFRANASLSIPRFGNAESLNVAVSCGIILSEFRRRG